jgi:HrpA-like RNA helicase
MGVDTGVCKREGYNPRARMHMLLTETISKASARQRQGRAGRTQPGICFRLYDEKSLDECFLPSSIPGILSQGITAEILLLKYMGHNDVAKFDFIEKPHPEVYLSALGELNDM